MAGHAASQGVEGVELQTPGAGPSRWPLPNTLVSLPRVCLSKKSVTNTLCPRTPTRSATDEDLELGLYLRPDCDTEDSSSQPSNGGVFASQRSAAKDILKVSSPHKSFFLANPTWRTDMVTFCSYARVDSVLGDARITHIQARKSYRLPFLHEYLLVFFVTASKQRFVMRIDRLGKLGSKGSGGPKAQQGITARTAVQEVRVYHVQDSQTGVNSVGAPWLEMDGWWGSRPVATLATWEALNEGGEYVSHHIQTAALSSTQSPRLKDVSRLLEAILLEMPDYNLTTANCYMMTRSSLLLLQRCHPSAFACYLGEMSDELTPASVLAEPVWAGLMRWYLPFIGLFFLVYFSLLMTFYNALAPSRGCWSARSFLADATCNSHRWIRALGHAVHSVLNVPVPVGAMHVYMTSLEVEMNKLVVNISTQFLTTGTSKANSESTPSQPFGVMFDSVWAALAVWWVIGCMFAICVFVSAAFEYGSLVTFCVLLVLGVWFNFKFSDNWTGMSSDEDDRRNIDDILGCPLPEDSGR